MQLVDMLKDLNNEQLEAVKTTEGIIRVIAGAGTGKTRALTTRYAYIMQELGVPTNRILSVTFTNKAANEMKSRIIGLIGGSAATPYITTFHSFCNKFLRDCINLMGFASKYKILDPDDQVGILKKVYADLGLNAKELPYVKCLKTIISDGCKTGSRTFLPNYEQLMANTSVKELGVMLEYAMDRETQIILRYLIEQKRDNCLDYEDLLNYTLYILKTNKEECELWQNCFDYVQVDEFQDVSMRELEIVAILSAKAGNLFVVGDDSQSIYSFREADVNCIVHLKEKLEEIYKKEVDVKTLFLKINYRSTRSIVDVSNALIKHNKNKVEKNLVTPNEVGRKVLHYHAKSVYQEAEWLVNRILTLKSKYSFSDMAVLYRSNALSRVIEEKLIVKRIPYQVLSGVSFYQRKEIKDVLAVLSIVAFEDNVSLRRVLKNLSLGVGTKKIEFLETESEARACSMYSVLAAVKDEKLFKKTRVSFLVDTIDLLRKLQYTEKLGTLIDIVLERFEIVKAYIEQDEEERVENLNELKKAAQHFEYDAKEHVLLADYLSSITLYTEADKEDEPNTVKLMTIHAAKGLEYKVVFVIGMDEGVMPSYRAMTPADIEEERRIAYVAMTRAKDLLFLTDAEGDNYDKSCRVPSRFLFNIPRDLYNSEGVIDTYLLNLAKRQIAMQEKDMGIEDTIEDTLDMQVEKTFSLKVGDRVRHSVFGVGTLLSVKNGVYLINFDKDKVRTIMASSGKVIKM